MSFSYTAPTHSKEDQEREYADLSQEEKEIILDDAYGRNSEEIAALNEREITEEEFDAFDEALENLPPEDHAEAAIAAKTVMCPELVERETNPSLFLRRENYNPQKAAKRFAAYWNFRVDLLDNEKAFLPISLAEGGAYHDDEVLIQMMKECPTYRYVIPNDKHGRSVLFAEFDQQHTATMQFSRQEMIKYNFYIIHRLMEQQSSISKGFVLLFFFDNTRKFNLNAFDRIKMKLTAKLVNDCIPIQVRAVHLLFSKSSFVTDLVLPTARYFFSPEFRQRMFHHHPCQKNKSGDHSTLEALESYGLCKEGLPECFRGTYKFNTSWVQGKMSNDGENE